MKSNPHAAPLRGSLPPRGGTPQEVADAIVFMASERASYVSGQVLQLNGGKTAA